MPALYRLDRDGGVQLFGRYDWGEGFAEGIVEGEPSAGLGATNQTQFRIINGLDHLAGIWSLGEFEEFIQKPRIRLTRITHETTQRYVCIVAFLRKMGRPFPTNGLWIAGAAMELGSELLTAGNHFLELPPILVAVLFMLDIRSTKE